MVELLTDEAGHPVPPVQTEAVHEEDEEGRAHVGVVEEGEEVEQREEGKVEGREEGFVLIVILE